MSHLKFIVRLNESDPIIWPLYDLAPFSKSFATKKHFLLYRKDALHDLVFAWPIWNQASLHRLMQTDFAGNMHFGAGLGIVLKDDTNQTDYYWWAGAANTFFWIDPDNNTVGVFLSQHFPVIFNLIDKLEEHVEESQI